VHEIKLVKPSNNAYFGPFEVDLTSGEVRKHGFKVRLQEKPFQLLAALLKQPGELVPRDELHQALWPDNHFVEFDHNLNNAINKLRKALCDSSEEPRYLETLLRRGYRFIAPVSWNGVEEQTEAAAALAPITKRGVPRTSAQRIWLALACSTAVLLLASFAALYVSRAQKHKIAFKARDWVLITAFDNRTGEPLLNGTLEYALERELSNSRFVNVVPRERVDDRCG
jgi:DNA-binding winged helix-turn-helix (wHTH) protein